MANRNLFRIPAIGLLLAASIVLDAAAQTSPYVIEWSRVFLPRQDCDIGFAPQATADQNEDLWLSCHDYLKQANGILHFSAAGRLVDLEKPHLKLPTSLDRDSAEFFLAASRNNLGLLINFDRVEGRASYFEGAFFTRIATDGIGAPRRISGPGPWFRCIVGSPDGGFLVAGDQEPLTLIKLSASGELQWRRSFSRRLVLPDVAVTTTRESYVAARAGPSVVVQRINADGQLIRRTSFPASQATVVVDPGGGCTLMYSIFARGKQGSVFLTALNQELRRLWTEPTPFIDKTGRTYQLIRKPDGYVALGDGKGAKTTVLAGFDPSGRLVWRQRFQADFTPLLVPTVSGFYLVVPASLANASTGNFTVIKEKLKQPR